AVAIVLLWLLRLLIGLGVITAAARRGGIARVVLRTIGGIDIAVVGSCLRLRHHALLLRRDHDGIAGGSVLLFILRLWGTTRDGGVAAWPRIARQRHPGRTGQRDGGVEH